MASRQMKMPVKDDAEKLPEADDVFSQRKRPELGRYLLQVDRQTKGSYTTSKAAQAAALVIKTDHPVVQVSVYDAVENTYTWKRRPRRRHERQAATGSRSFRA
jgi:formylglycine-generating enzyme required for sulfatase activity